MAVSNLEALCRCEVQRVLTHLRGHRHFRSLSHGWQELEESHPIRQLVEWRTSKEVNAVDLLRPLLGIVRSPAFAGPTTCLALEAAQALLVALAEAGSAELPRLLAEVSEAVCECVFEETHPQTDEATALQMISLLGLCTSALSVGGLGPSTVLQLARKDSGLELMEFSVETRCRSFQKVLSLWEHYRNSHVLRSCARSMLQTMLDVACAEFSERNDCLLRILQSILEEVEQGIVMEKALLYLRCLQRLTTHSSARKWCFSRGKAGLAFQELVPLILLRIAAAFGESVTVLSLLLPCVNRVCWLCVEGWCSRDGEEQGGENEGPSPVNGDSSSTSGPKCITFGALQMEALLTTAYLGPLLRAASPLLAQESTPTSASATPPMRLEEAIELLVVVLEGLSDLLQAETVRTIWMSFDADWRRPPLLEPIIKCISELFKDTPSTERQLPAHVVHLCATVLSKAVAGFDAMPGGSESSELPESVIKEPWERREALLNFMQKFEDSPKKARMVFEQSGLSDLLPLPPKLFPNSEAELSNEEWAQKLTWVFRCLNHAVPYSALGEFFGQPKDDSKDVFALFVDSFDMGRADLHEALRGVMEAFRLPGEAQQIDRVVQTFGEVYFRKHLEYYECEPDNIYLKNSDAAYTLAFSVIMLNVDQHNPKLKKRMVVKDFISNNRAINDGGNIPPEVLTRIFLDLQKREIKTPPSGSLGEPLSQTRWKDYSQLIEKGYRDNALGDAHAASRAHVQGFLHRTAASLRVALEQVLATDVGSNSDALEGLERLWHLTLQNHSAESNVVAEGLFLFGTEVFHQPQKLQSTSRAAACLRALFRTALSGVSSMTTRQLHMMVYLTVQFALCGFSDRCLPADSPASSSTSKLLKLSLLSVDPPTGVVYSFLRKISAAPFKMLSYAEESPSAGEAQEEPDPLLQALLPTPQEVDDKPAPETSGTPVEMNVDAAASTEEAGASPKVNGSSEASLDLKPKETPRAESLPQKESSQSLSKQSGDVRPSLPADPLRSQLEVALGACGLDDFTKTLVKASSGGGTGGGGGARSVAASEEKDGAAGGEGSCRQVLLSYVSALFLALRLTSSSASKNIKEQDLPWWPAPPEYPALAQQSLQLPRRALALNVMDGFEVMRFALRLGVLALRDEDNQATEEASTNLLAVQELAVCAHAGLLHTLRRSDLAERSLKTAIIAVFEVGSALLRQPAPPNSFAVSIGWPVRLMEILVQRAEGEPHSIVMVARVVVEATRSFLNEVSKVRIIDRVEVWKAMLALLFRAMPCESRALWSGNTSREVEMVQRDVWKRGIIWVLCHPDLMDCLGAEDLAASQGATATAVATVVTSAPAPTTIPVVSAISTASAAAAADPSGASSPSAGSPAATSPPAMAGAAQTSPSAAIAATPSTSSSAQLLPASTNSDAVGSAAFWNWALPALTQLANGLAGGNKLAVAKLLLEAHRTLLLVTSSSPSPEEHASANGELAQAQERAASSSSSSSASPSSSSSSSARRLAFVAGRGGGGVEEVLAARAAALCLSWSRLAVGMLGILGPSLGKGLLSETEQLVPLLKQALLGPRIPLLLEASVQGPYWARLVLEKLVTMLTSSVKNPTSALVVRDSAPLVSKFFLQNLHTLQRQEHFGQLWLMVLRLIVLFAKRGHDERNNDLAELALEELKLLLRVLLSERVLGFIAGKGGSGAAQTAGETANPPVWWQMTWDCIEVFLPGFGDNFSKAERPRESPRQVPPSDANTGSEANVSPGAALEGKTGSAAPAADAEQPGQAAVSPQDADADAASPPPASAESVQVQGEAYS